MTSFFRKAIALAGRFWSGAARLAGGMRWSYVPPLMVYFAAGVSGFTGIIEAFFVKEKLGFLMIVTMAIGLVLPVVAVWALQPRAKEQGLSLGARFKLLKAIFSITQSP